jgi:hypothetical protein
MLDKGPDTGPDHQGPGGVSIQAYPETRGAPTSGIHRERRPG